MKYDDNMFNNESFVELIGKRLNELGDIPKSDKMEIINEEFQYTNTTNGVENVIKPYNKDDIFKIKISENVGITNRDLEIYEIIRNMDFCLITLRLLKQLQSSMISYPDIIVLTTYLKLLNKYNSMEAFLDGMSIEEYNNNVKILGFSSKKTILDM